MPNFSLAPAIDVLTLGAYPRLPTCIRDRIIPPPSLSVIEKQDACRLLESVIRQRLSRESLPSPLTVTQISKKKKCTIALSILGGLALVPLSIHFHTMPILYAYMNMVSSTYSLFVVAPEKFGIICVVVKLH